MDPRTLLTTTEAATLIGISPDTIRSLIHRGRLAAFRIPPHGHFRIEQAAVLTALTRVEPEQQHTRASDLKRLGQDILARIRAEKRPVLVQQSSGLHPKKSHALH